MKETKTDDQNASKHDTFDINVYNATGANNYFLICENDFVAVGCSDGHFGLWLDKNLEKGVSSKVSTFENDVLTTFKNFTCTSIEIWEIKPE